MGRGGEGSPGAPDKLAPCCCLQQALREAQDDLEVTRKVLGEAKQRLHEVEDGIATLQAKYRECVSKKEELELKCEQCEQRLGRADKVCIALSGGPVGAPDRDWMGRVVLGWLAAPPPLQPGALLGRGAQIPSPASQSPPPPGGAASAAHQWAVGREGTLAGDGGESGAHA